MNTGSLSDVINTVDATPTNSANAAFSPPNSSGGFCELEVTGRIPGTNNTVSWLAQTTWRKNLIGGLTIGTLTNIGGAALGAVGPQAADTTAFTGATIALVGNAQALTPQVTGLVATNITWTIVATYYVNP